MSYKNLKYLLHISFVAFSCFLLVLSFFLIIINTPVEAKEGQGDDFKVAFNQSENQLNSSNMDDNNEELPDPSNISNSESQTNSITFENPLGPTGTIEGLVNHILAFALKLAIPIATIMIIWSGFLFATSAGNEEKIKTAQKTLIWAIVGLGVAIIATTIPALVQEFLGTSEQTETGWECDYTRGECYGGVSGATYSSWEACEEDCIQKPSDSTSNQNFEGFTTPPIPASEIKAAFIYDSDSTKCQENNLIFTNCCKPTQTTSESSYQCKNWLDIR